MSQYYGKYRGTVANNIDPENRGRIQARVPAIFGDFPLNWAEPCVPYAGMQSCFYAMPPLNANVWIEFEGGNSEKPIWSGCFWGIGELPALATVPTPPTVPHLLFQTVGRTTLLVSDAPGPAGGIQLKAMSGEMILINSVGITISNGKGATIQLTANNVSINGIALVVS